MKKDIQIPEVKNIILAAVTEESIWKKDDWYVYIVNVGKETITNLLVVSRGYGEINNEQKNTSVLRHHFDELKPNEYLKIEPIMEEVFGLTNEYWISYYIDKNIFDKQYIFLAESINKNNCVQIPLVNKPGVMLR